MEESIYNIVESGDNSEHILYNTLKRCLVVLDDEAYADYKAGEGAHQEELKKAGVLVDSARYEQEIQEKQFDEDRKTNDWFALCLCPTYECNYACPYCYEHGYTNDKGIMQADVIEKIYEFFERVYERDHFKKFSVSWYGGEPTLCMDIIEEVSDHFRRICEDRDIDFSIGILSNCGKIDKNLAGRMAKCGIEHLMPTIDGMHDLHNRRRVVRGSGDAFESTVQGACNCKEAGIRVSANMNTDRINMKEFRELREYMHDNYDIDMYPSLLKDYRQDFGKNDTGFKEPEYKLYTREDYAHDIHTLFAETPFSREVIEGLFRPVRDFCRGQLENYFVIDSLGDVYTCEGWVGQKEYVLFNLFDLDKTESFYHTSYNPLRDPECRDCNVMPLCKGQCSWDRALLEHACHVAKFIIGDYVKDYRSCFGEAHDPVTVFVEPTTPEFYLEKPFECDGPNEARWAGIPWYETDEEGVATFTKGKFYKEEERAKNRG